jgi:hypothetical protein
MAEFAYLDNPLPALFKGKLFMWLSRAYGVPRAGKQKKHLLQKKYRVKVSCGRGFAMTALV